jgi:hypothetical protein
MLSNLVFYQLVLIALVWVFLMLYGLWPSEPAAARPTPPEPVTPRRKRSCDPKPFIGLTRQPPCDPPPLLVSTRGRGIRLRRDNWVSVRYAEELNSTTSSVTLQRADRHGILGEKPPDFQVSL